jgi:putative transposase
VRDVFGRDGVSERRACRVIRQSRSTQRRVRRVPDDEPRLVKRIEWLACEYGRYGYRRITVLLHWEGWRVNHKRVERIWREEGLKVPKKQPKRRRLWLNDGSCIRLRPTHRNHVWSYDFVMDRTSDGRPIRMLTIVDEYTRECLAIDVAKKLTSEDVLERLSDLFVRRGVPEHPERQWQRVHRQVRPGVAGTGRREDAVHRAGVALGERLRGELQRQASGRAPEAGVVRHPARGQGAD